MSIIYSGTTIATVKYGSTTLDKVYYGSTLVYQRDTNTYIFNNGTLGSGVTLSYGSITGSYIQIYYDGNYATSRTYPHFVLPSALPNATVFYAYIYVAAYVKTSTLKIFYYDSSYGHEDGYTISADYWHSVGYHTLTISPSQQLYKYTYLNLYFYPSSTSQPVNIYLYKFYY